MAKARSKRRKKRGWKFKLLIFLLLAGTIGGLSYFALKKEKPEETFATIEVKRGDLVDKLAETGTIELVRTVEVKSTISGKIRELLVEAGDWVEKDQLMAIIEPDPNQSLQLYRQRAMVELRKINLQEQEKDFERKKALFESKMVPSKEFEDAETRLVQAKNNLSLAELELEIMETKANLTRTEGQTEALELDEVRVLAPIGGIAIRRGVEIGEVVASGLSAFSGGTLLFEIGDPSQMVVRGDIAEIDIAKLQVEQDVDIVVDAYPDTTYHGRVRWIAPVGQKKQGSPIVTFDTEINILDREPRLRQGMSCDLDIIFSRRDSTLYLPVEAVLEIFDDQEDGEEEIKGRRGRFVTYVVRPADSTAVDSTAADSLASSSTDTTALVSRETSATDTTVLDSEAIAAADRVTLDSAVTAAADTVGLNPAAEPDTTVVSVDTLAATPEEAASAGEFRPDTTVTLIDTTFPDISAAAGEPRPDTTVVLADSAALDTSASADTSTADTLASASADTTAEKKPDEPPQAKLDDFVEVELEIGLETSTRIEILSGLEDGERIAEDPQLIRTKKEEQAKEPKKEDEGLF